MKQHILPTAPRSCDDDAAPTPVDQVLLDATLVRFEIAFERTLATLLAPADGSPVVEHVRWHFGIGCDAALHGKRLRPRLLFAVAFEEGGSFDGALDAALAIEFLHNYSLVHDDIEDRDVLRRNRETVWARFGLAQGINAGDAVCAITYLTLLAGTARAPVERVVAATRVLHRANLAMCVGQSYDLAFESASDVSVSEYLAMVDGKTASLFGAACEMGALCAGNDEARARAYAQVGCAYGRAFQIRDDVRGLRSDLARRKWSYPVVWALAGPPSAARSAIAARYAKGSPLDADDVTAVASALERLGARDAAEEACARHVRRAQLVAERCALDPRGAVRRTFAAP
jgi:geranylgeranyl diphosphate synthase type I